MNTSNNGLAFMKLDVYRVTRELVVRVRALKIGDKELRDQATRAATRSPTKCGRLWWRDGRPGEFVAVRMRDPRETDWNPGDLDYEDFRWDVLDVARTPVAKEDR